uniref:Uncharacterized protein n=1 Tax=Oryza brachyantha TaxID=4533 RepID=J3M6V3_ORYBR
LHGSFGPLKERQLVRLSETSGSDREDGVFLKGVDDVRSPGVNQGNEDVGTSSIIQFLGSSRPPKDG